MNEPVENLEMAETKEMVSDAYRTNCPRGTVAVPDKLSPRYGCRTGQTVGSSRFGHFLNTC